VESSIDHDPRTPSWFDELDDQGILEARLLGLNPL
jgi:hypothetical protein